MPRPRVRLLVLLAAGLLLASSPAWGRREHIVHFPDTPYELHVFKIQGRKPGPTLMLIGGIQGDEPGGFLSADLYADMSLEQGNLIVVPRANFYSIMLKSRGPNGDMNRKFNQSNPSDREMQIVAVLKDLMTRSDCLLNLHDGSGFYRPTYVSATMNQQRFGQSLIADTDVYLNPATGRVINLKEMAQKICAEINQAIENPFYHFHFNNHQTFDPRSPNREQIGSATFYALTRAGIAAFGVETSKQLPTVEMKVRHHNLAINAFMRHLGIVPEHPGVDLKEPELRYLVVSINNERPVVVANKDTLTLKRGDRIFVSHVETNYQRGLSVDIMGLGGVNDYRREFTVNAPTSVIVRKDHAQCGWVRLVVKDADRPPETEPNPTAQYFLVEVNGQEKLVGTGQTLELIKGDRLKLLDSWSAKGQKGLFDLNFKGFVPPGRPNSGDDRGEVIATDEGLMERWSLQGRGRKFPVVAEKGKDQFGEFYVKLSEPSLEYLIIHTAAQTRYALGPGETLILDGRKKSFQIMDVKANFDTKSGLRFLLRRKGREVSLVPRQWIDPEEVFPAGKAARERLELVVLRHNAPVGRFFLASGSVRAGSGKIEPAS